MPAYVLIEIDVHDPAAFEEYKREGPLSIAAYGGRYLARGGRTESLEGGWSPKRLVIVEFDSLERAKEWWTSEDYRRAKDLRQRSASTRMVAIEGV